MDGHQRRMLSSLRSKMSKDDLQTASQMSSLVCALHEELQGKGLPPWHSFSNSSAEIPPWSCSCRQVLVQAKPRRLSEKCCGNSTEVAVTEKSGNFKMTDISAVQDLLKGHVATQSSLFPVNNQRRMVAAGELQREEYDLMIEMFNHDLVPTPSGAYGARIGRVRSTMQSYSGKAKGSKRPPKASCWKPAVNGQWPCVSWQMRQRA